MPAGREFIPPVSLSPGSFSDTSLRDAFNHCEPEGLPVYVAGA
jgi:hypothetical protein